MRDPRVSVAVFVVQRKMDGHDDLARVPGDGTERRSAERWHRRIHRGTLLVPLLARSARRIYPHAEIVLLTDDHGSLSDISSPVRVVKHAASQAPLTYEKLLAYAEYLETAADDRSHFFLDSDILITSAFTPPPGVPFDIALTLKGKKGRVNSGVIVVAPNGRGGALRLLRKALRIYEERYFQDPHWGNDQAALREAAGFAGSRKLPELLETPEARVLLLACDRYNYWPSNDWRLAMAPPGDRFAIHFKGGLKRFMPCYFRLHVDPDRSVVARAGLRATVFLRAGLDSIRARRHRRATLGVAAPGERRDRIVRLF